MPTLSGSAPLHLKQAESAEVTLNGANLGGASALAITDPRGLAVELVPGGKPAANQVKIKLTAGPDAALGPRELRLITPLGVTAPLVVTVGQYTATRETEPNNTPEQSATLAFPTSIIGRIDNGGDVDSFRFDARKGQHLVFDVHAARLGSPLDPVVTILNAAGHEQPRTVSHRGGDTTIVFQPPADGSYHLQIRDVQFRGSGDYAYRIDAGEIPFIESIVPAGGRRGSKVEVRAIGHNLGSSDVQTVDLTSAEPGVMELRFKTSVGLSNDLPFTVTDFAPVAEKGSNDSAKTATPVSLPAEVSGVLAKAGEEDFYRFTVPTRQSITIEAIARRTGSPVDALLVLRDAKGTVLEQTNGAGEAEARISRAFEPGDYVLSIRDLTFGGGANYSYRVNLFPAGGMPADFAVRFMPDAPRVGRGSHMKLWCEIVRLNGYKGAVAVSLEGLPPGVTVSGGPAMIGESTSGIFTVSAAADAPLGSFPIKLKAVGSAGAQQTIRHGEPELNGRFVKSAYLTVLDNTPFTVDAIAEVKPEQIASYQADALKLFAKLNTSTPELEKAQAEWEKKTGGPIDWKPLKITSTTSTDGTALKVQPNGEITTDGRGGKSPEKDTYTVTADVSVKQIAAVRLEAIADSTLPASGPGRNVAGNFVLSRFTATVAPKDDPSKTQPIVFKTASATFEQPNYPANGSIGGKARGGWAIFGGTGKNQAAWFYPEKPVPAGDVVLTFTLDQQFGQKHTLGRFRLSVSDDPQAKENQGEPVPPVVAAIVKVPAEQRTAEQKAALANYYRSISPELKAERSKLEALRLTVGPFAEVARLEAILNQNNPVLDADRKEWEKSLSKGPGWTAVQVGAARGSNGTSLEKEKDGSIIAVSPARPGETFVVTATTPVRSITAIRLEAISDERLPGSGPGWAADGNFVLSRFDVTVTPPAAPPAAKDDPAKAKPAGKGKSAKEAKADAKSEEAKPTTEKPPAEKPAAASKSEPKEIVLKAGAVSFAQKDYGLAGVLDDKPETGWAIAPLMGRPQTATFLPESPIITADGATLTFRLTFAAPKLQNYSLGRFRIWVIGEADPSSTAAIPAEIQEILKIPEATRTEQQKSDVNAYYRSIAPALEPTRQRHAELKRKLPTLPLVLARNKNGVLPIPISRSAAFTGPVQLTLEGFSAGRDPKDRNPTPIAKNFDITALTADPQTALARLTIKPKANSELGTRMVVIRAEGKVGNDTYVQYSPAFPITVVEK